MAINIIMPEMGEGVIEGTIARWLKQAGDAVARYEPILEIETDKVTTEAVAEEAGTLLQISVPAGETVPVGTVLGVIGDPAVVGAPQPAAVAPTAAAHSEPQAARAPAKHSNGSPAGTPVSSAGRSLGRISPVVARMAEEHAIDLYAIEGSGRDGRITKQDVVAYLERQAGAPAPTAPVVEAPSAPRPVFAPPPRAIAAAPAPAAIAQPPQPSDEDTLIPHSNMRRMIAEHMVQSKQTSPHVTTVFEVDFSAVMAHRSAHKAEFEAQGVRLTLTPYIMAAIAQALRRHPRVNSTWRDDGLLVKREVNIGMATALESGLIVPVIRQADELNLIGLARRVNDLAERARSNRLKPAEIQGGTFSVTNHGISGSLFATPVINQPQCGIMGVGKVQKRVVVIDDMLAIRPMAYVSFTFDHRILDGATADAFVQTFVDALEGWR